jgi:hypothetical protein
MAAGAVGVLPELVQVFDFDRLPHAKTVAVSCPDAGGFTPMYTVEDKYNQVSKVQQRRCWGRGGEAVLQGGLERGHAAQERVEQELAVVGWVRLLLLLDLLVRIGSLLLDLLVLVVLVRVGGI